MNTELKQAVETLCNALHEDKSEGSYYYSWQANIAMAFKDEFDRKAKEKEPHFTKWLFTENGLHEIANNAAKNFLDQLCLKTEKTEDPYKKIAEQISEIFFYGNFKVETPAEAELEKRLIEVGLWPTTEDKIIERHQSEK